MLQNIFSNCFYNTCVYTDQFFSCHTRFSGKPGSYNYYITAGSFRIIIGGAGDLGVKAKQGCGLHHVLRLTFSDTFFDIQ